MIASPKTMDILKGIGLNLYERKLWVALLARGTSTAGELSEIAGVPRSRAYDIMQSLADKGFVVVQNAKPIRYVAVEPTEAIDRAKKKMEQDMESMREKMDDLKSSGAIKELSEIFGKGMKVVSSEDLTGALKGKHLFNQHMDTMFKSAGKSIKIVTTVDGLRELHDNHFNSLKKASDSGVKIKIAAPHHERNHEATRNLSSIADVRHIDEKSSSLGGRFCVIDESEMLMGLTDPKSMHDTQHVAIWSKSEHAAAKLMEPVFEMIWNSSKSI